MLLGAGMACAALATYAAAAATSADEAAARSTTYTFATRGCTQEDVPALEIYFTHAPFAGRGDPSPPYIRFEIGTVPGEAIPAGPIELVELRRGPEHHGRIARGELVVAGQVPIWLQGTITFTEAAAGKGVTGYYDVTTPAGTHLYRAFDVEYTPRTAACG